MAIRSFLNRACLAECPWLPFWCEGEALSKHRTGNWELLASHAIHLGTWASPFNVFCLSFPFYSWEKINTSSVKRLPIDLLISCECFKIKPGYMLLLLSKKKCVQVFLLKVSAHGLFSGHVVVCVGTFSSLQAAPGFPSPSQGQSNEIELGGIAGGSLAAGSAVCAGWGTPGAGSHRGLPLETEGWGRSKARSPLLCWREEWVLWLIPSVNSSFLSVHRAAHPGRLQPGCLRVIQRQHCSLQHCSTATASQHTCTPTQPLQGEGSGLCLSRGSVFWKVPGQGELGSSACSSWLLAACTDAFGRVLQAAQLFGDLPASPAPALHGRDSLGVSWWCHHHPHL